MISGNHCNSLRIPDGSSVFTAEAKAIDLALDFINSYFPTDKFLIFSDSLSVLKALNHTSTRNSGGGRVVRWYWVNFQCQGVLQFG